MSEREEAQVRFAERLKDDERFTDKIISKLEDVPSGGKVRTITFGIKGALSVKASIWKPDHITFQKTGMLHQRIPDEVKSINEFFTYFNTHDRHGKKKPHNTYE